jgi:hypothetical protein
MILSTALMMMLAAPADVGTGRKAFGACLSAQIKPALEAKISLEDFRAGLKTKCAKEEAAFREAILATDKADGMPLKGAQADADDQVMEYVEKISGEYADYQSTPG